MEKEVEANIAMIIGPKGFQDLEFGVPYKYFLSKGAQVDVYSTVKGEASGVFGSTFQVEHSLKDLDVTKYDAIVYVGGPGTVIVRAHPNSTKIAKEAYDEVKVIGAICWSPTILAKSGILKNKNATVWIGQDAEFKTTTDKYIESCGAKFTGEDVTVDGNIVTANGPMAASEYAKEIWKLVNR